MQKREPVLIKELTERERLCFSCPVPSGCNETDPRCLLRSEISQPVLVQQLSFEEVMV